MRLVHATTLPWNSSKHYRFSVCVCSLRYPACKGHAPYCRPWPAPLYNIFPHYLTKGTIKNLFNTQWVFRVLSDILLSSEEVSEILSYSHIDLHVKCRHSCQVLMKLRFSRQILEEYLNIACNKKNRSVGAELSHVD